MLKDELENAARPRGVAHVTLVTVLLSTSATSSTATTASLESAVQRVDAARASVDEPVEPQGKRETPPARRDSDSMRARRKTTRSTAASIVKGAGRPKAGGGVAGADAPQETAPAGGEGRGGEGGGGEESEGKGGGGREESEGGGALRGQLRRARRAPRTLAHSPHTRSIRLDYFTSTRSITVSLPVSLSLPPLPLLLVSPGHALSSANSSSRVHVGAPFTTASPPRSCACPRGACRPSARSSSGSSHCASATPGVRRART